MSIKPGIAVDIHIDPSSANLNPLKAVIYDVRGKRLVLSQTSPPLLPPPPTGPVDISYIIMKRGSTRRFGFSARVSGFGDHYELSSGLRVPTIIVEMKRDPEEKSLRKGFRIRPRGSSGLALTIQANDYPIFDISQTGVNFIQLFPHASFRPSAVVECWLKIDGRDYPLNARIIRVVETAVARYVSAVFVNPGRDLQPALSRKILQLEREELSRYRIRQIPESMLP